MNSNSTQITDRPNLSSTGDCKSTSISDVNQSIELNLPSRRWEFIGLTALLTAPLAFLGTCNYFCDGLDLTWPFLLANAGAVLIAIYLVCKRSEQASHAALGLATILIAFAISWFATETYLLGIVRREYLIQFSIVDDQTGRPFHHAMVVLTDISRASARARSDENGRIAVPFDFRGGCKSSPVCRTGHVGFHGVTVDLVAEGFHPFTQNLGTLLPQGWSIYGPPPPIVEIRLQPKR